MNLLVTTTQITPQTLMSQPLNESFADKAWAKRLVEAGAEAGQFM